MSQERRRYFRITDTIGFSYTVLTDMGDEYAPQTPSANTVFSQFEEQDKRIEKALLKAQRESPAVAELVSLFNQKIERMVNLLSMEGALVEQMAARTKEVNISACGIAFINEEALSVGTPMNMELSLMPDDIKIFTQGRVVGCEPAPQENEYYMRVDFFGMNAKAQEVLIQHIVKNQNQQLQEKNI